MTLRVHPTEIVAASNSPLLGTAPWWERTRLGDIADVINGAAFKSAQFNNDQRGMPLIRIRDVGKSETAVHYDGEYEERHVVEHGSLLIGMDGDFRIARWEGPTALLNQRVCMVQVRNPNLYDERFLLHCVQPYLDAVHAETSSVTVKHLSSRTVQDLPIPLPPRAEQERIVAATEEHFSRLDAAEVSIDHAAAKIDMLRSAVEGDWFEEWPVKPLAEVCDPDRVIRYGILKPGDDYPGGVPVVKVRDYPKGKILADGLKRTTPEIADKYAGATLKAGDVLVSIRGTFGRVAPVPPELEGANITQDSARLAPRPVIGRDYLIHYLRSAGAQRHLQRVARGVAVKGVNIGDLRKLPVPLPPMAEQRRIVAELDDAWSLAEQVEAACSAAVRRVRLMRRSVLAAAFSGHLASRDPSDEPANQLLERIRTMKPTERRSRKKVSS